MARPRPSPQPGDRLFVQCKGGPSTSLLVDFPLPLEIEQRTGVYILNDDGGQDDWAYFFVPNEI